ncbi:hypothetical protein [Streptomyces sp. TRM68416]|uniref:hypothetical protein n=1 Tax=Streptomyces sp. TRM68416 TaxID=2758412 RepID=UPI001661DA48|nr:hypothetical protein [Streptomyces sp. TRM68416]MBD0844489.1 hypothetical protein [Streptomyces sp. TRM68416]
MWPGNQPPGDGQTPQQPNSPYRQPGYRQPNPYVQRQPATWDAPAAGPAPPGRGRRTGLIAIVAATAVAAAAVVTGAVLLGGDADDKASPGPGPTASPTATASESDATQPTVDGWKVVANPDIGVAFDVPADWAPQSPDWVSYVSEDDDPEDTPLVAMKAPAVLKAKWCTSDDDKDGHADDTALASAGSRGNRTAKSTEQIARTDSANWVYGGYTQPDRAKVTTGPVTSFTTDSGLTGSVATSQSSGVERRGRCDSDGKATTFAFENADGDFASWSFVAAKGVGEEVPDTTIRQIMRTVRLYTPPTDH